MTQTPRVFQAATGFRVPDTTYVFPFLNSNDAQSGLPPGLLDAFSLAIGEIEPTSSSKIHVHPFVTQVTLVLDGRIEVQIRDNSAPLPYTVLLAQHQATMVRPGGFLQFRNRSVFPCRVLYAVGPAYVFDVDDQGRVRYDDAVTVDESWEELEDLKWMPPRLQRADVTPQAREDALRRIRDRRVRPG